MIDKLLNMFDKFNIKRATDLISTDNKTLHLSWDLFYPMETMILQEYQHVKTPPSVTEFLELLKRKPLERADLQKTHVKFCMDSVAYAKRRETQGNPIKHVFIKTYEPSFDALNKDQKEWYFYWRKEVLRGNYLYTDSGYVFIFVYELLNYTFNENAAFNLSMLDRICLNYHNKDYSLDHLLPRWICDFCYELGEYGLETKWTAKISNYEFSDYETLKEYENKLGTVSIAFWKRFIRYNKTAFFKTNRNIIYKIFKTSVALLEREYQAQGKNLIEAWIPLDKSVSFERQLFQNAVVGRKAQNKLEVKRFPSLKMREDLAGLFRLAKNITRVRAGEKRQLNGDEALFPEGFSHALMDLFEDKTDSSPLSGSRFVKARDKGQAGVGSSIPHAPENPEQVVATIPLIEFDLERIDTLDKESKELLEIFALRYDEEDEVDHYDKPDLKKGNNVVETLKVLEKQNKIEMQSETEEFEPFIAELTKLESEFLLGFKDLLRVKQEGIDYLKTRGVMMGVFMSTLNEKSLDYLGDNLIEQEGDILRFNEDFRQVLQRLAEEE